MAVTRHDNRTVLNGAPVSFRGVTKSFGERAVLKDIALDIAPGEFVALIGKSGCGKTTLLRLIAGLETPTSGELFVDNRPVSGPSPQTRVLFQDARLLPWRSVQANVALGIAEPFGKRLAEEKLGQVGLQDRGDDWPGVLSGGQRQRVALARALASTPRLLLLDEPLGALDALTRIEMQNLILDIWQSGGFTTVLVTHDIEEAVFLADRVLLIEEGRIVREESVTQARPRSRTDADLATLREQLLAHVLAPSS